MTMYFSDFKELLPGTTTTKKSHFKWLLFSLYINVKKGKL